MAQTNPEIVQELFDRMAAADFSELREALDNSSSLAEVAARTGELGRWLDHLDPEVEIDASAVPAMPEGNRARGHRGWFEFWRDWLLPWESFEYRPKRWREAGNQVLVEFTQRGRLAGGLEYATPVSNVWTFENGAVVRLQVFVTWEDALKAAGLAE